MSVGQDFDSPPTGPPITSPDGAPGKSIRALPTRIGKYHIKRLLGLGGMGAVYEAVQEQPHRTVALKVMKRGVTSASALRRFEYEAQLLARLRHPGIAQVYEAGTHEEDGDRVPYFAMEYIPSASHLTRYAHEKKLSIRQRLELFVKVCEAVEHGHQRAIIHRDLKPANILVDGSGQPKVIDFGVARATDSDLFFTTLQTGLGEMIGTLPYMSPEQCAGDPHDLDARSDVYSLGVVLYELLTERLPYDLTKVAMIEAARRIREQPPARPSTINRTLRGDVETIALKALEKDRARRYSSAAALGEDVRRYLHGEPIDARRDSAAYVAWTLLRSRVARHPILSFLLAATVATAAAHLVAVPVLFRHWTWPALAFDRLTNRFMTVPTTAAGLENVRIIAIRDGTDYDALGAVEGLPDVSASDWTSMRQLHGRLMEKLAAAGARTVAWDVIFSRSSPFDTDFVRGVEAVRSAGGEVVVGVSDWHVDQGGVPVRDGSQPGISREIGSAPGLRWGNVTLGTGEHVLAQMAVRRGPAPPEASFALQAVAAWRYPGSELYMEMNDRTDALTVMYLRPDATIPQARAVVGGPEVIPLPALTRRGMKLEQIGLKPGDLVGYFPILVPEESAFDPVTRDYESAVRASPENLRAWCSGKLVLIGDVRQAGSDFHTIPGGRKVPGLHLQAATIGALFSGQAFRLPNESEALGLVAIFAVIGVAVVGITGRRWVIGTLTIVFLGILAVALGIVLCREFRLLVYPLVPEVSLALGALMGYLVVLAQGRYQGT